MDKIHQHTHDAESRPQEVREYVKPKLEPLEGYETLTLGLVGTFG